MLGSKGIHTQLDGSEKHGVGTTPYSPTYVHMLVYKYENNLTVFILIICT